MNVSLSWLKELVKYDLSPQELADKLSLRSIGVKGVTNDFLELDLTYNRSDLLSLRGVAREVAVITGSKINFTDLNTLNQNNLPKTKVLIEDYKLSPIQCSAKIENLKVGPSHKEWVKKLKDSGMRSVNNIVDVTNLIMIEFGHPLHAFDASSVKDETIVVRAAKEGEELLTLDGKLRKLSTQDIVLADTEKPLDVGGVMGGKDTEVKEPTSIILLSASLFNPVMVRNTSKKLGLYSEASKRFQHGLTRTNLLNAYFAAIKMYESLGGKLTAISLVGDLEDKPKTVKLTQRKLNSLLGVDISSGQVESVLKKLGLHPKGVNGGLWDVTVPYWRLDINIEEDLIEEVARIYGYEKIIGKPLEGEQPEKLDQSIQNFIHNLKVSLKDAGLTEVQTYSFYSSQAISNFKFKISNLVKVANPISSETEYLRDQIWPNLVEVVGKNMRNGYKDIAIFEVGKVYQPGPRESYRLAIAIMNGTDNPTEELVSIFNQIASHLGSGNVKLKMGEMMKELETLFHPTRFATIKAGGKVIGGLAEVHPRFLNNFGIEKRVAILEISLPLQ